MAQSDVWRHTVQTNSCEELPDALLGKFGRTLKLYLGVEEGGTLVNTSSHPLPPLKRLLRLKALVAPEELHFLFAICKCRKPLLKKERLL